MNLLALQISSGDTFVPVLFTILLIIAALIVIWLLFYRKVTLKNLRQQVEFNDKILRVLHEGYVLVDEDARIIDVNPAYCKMVGYSKEELLSMSLTEVRPGMSEEYKKEFIQTVVKLGSKKFETQHRTKDGRMIDLEASAAAVERGGKIHLADLVSNVTDRKEKERIIAASLSEKEVLLREIHHRVKNNMAVISGLLELQIMNSATPEVQETLKKSQLRILSMTMIHEKLYQTETFININFKEYIEELVRSITRIFDFPEKNISICYQVDPAKLNMDQAIPCALILNELVVNCYKHAFNGTDEGEIVISLRNNGEVSELAVADNGEGLPENFTLKSKKGLGMTLIRTLSKQLEGDLLVHSNSKGRGSSFKIRFRRG